MELLIMGVQIKLAAFPYKTRQLRLIMKKQHMRLYVPFIAPQQSGTGSSL